MYDLGYFRNNLDAIAARLGDRGFVLDVESFRKLDVERRAALSESEAIKAQRNAETQEIGKLKRRAKTPPNGRPRFVSWAIGSPSWMRRQTPSMSPSAR